MTQEMIDFMGKKIIVDENVKGDFFGGEGPIAAKYLKIQEGEVFFDVGASWAMWTLYGIACGAYVYAFEPSVPHYNNLVGYIKANEGFMERCKPLNIALDRVENVKTLGDWAREHGWIGPITPELTPDHFIPTTFKTIDSFLPELKRLDWIKIDVEGGEYDVLLGGLVALQKFKPQLIIENHLGVDQIGDWMRANKIYEKMLELLRSLNYTITEEPHQGRGFIICSK
jgi:FkbM family methyltransferase